jgi:(R,R)-butanediol dehydrogenase/meso-butanediol dehydrogenase/diacetyl reductase
VDALLITGKERAELVEFPEPVPARDGVVVDIAYCGVCGTDIHAFKSGEPYNPAVCGHEWSGTLSAVGAEVHGLKEGDRVVVGVPPACGSCDSCRAGHADKCTIVLRTATGRGPGAASHGGFAPRVAVDKGRVILAEPGLSDEEAAQIEPTAVAFHAVRRSGIRLGDSAVVQGAGPIGLVTLQLARAAGAGQVIVIEPSQARRELALELGAVAVAAPGDEAAQLIVDATGGLGADVVFECVGRPDTVQTAVELARRGGTMSLIGLAAGQVLIDPRIWLNKEIEVSASLAYVHEEFAMTMGMVVDGRVRLEPLHSATVSLQDLGKTLADLAAGTSTETKVLVDPR